MIEEDNDELIYNNSSKKNFSGLWLDEIASQCADYDYNHCDGWESHDAWKKGKTIVLFDVLTKKIVGKFKTRGEESFDFYADEIKD